MPGSRAGSPGQPSGPKGRASRQKTPPGGFSGTATHSWRNQKRSPARDLLPFNFGDRRDPRPSRKWAAQTPGRMVANGRPGGRIVGAGGGEVVAEERCYCKGAAKRGGGPCHDEGAREARNPAEERRRKRRGVVEEERQAEQEESLKRQPASEADGPGQGGRLRGKKVGEETEAVGSKERVDRQGGEKTQRSKRAVARHRRAHVGGGAEGRSCRREL